MKREEKIDRDIDQIIDPDRRTLVRSLHKAIIVIFSLLISLQSKIIYDKNNRIEKQDMTIEKMLRDKDSIAQVRLKKEEDLVKKNGELLVDGIKREHDLQKVLKKYQK